MKLEMLNAVKNTAMKMVSPKKAEKAATVAIKENGEKMMASAQDAAAAQGRAMVKPYVKPEMQVVELKKSNLRAASDYNDRGGNARYMEYDEEFDF